jgi:hypothetical protein
VSNKRKKQPRGYGQPPRSSTSKAPAKTAEPARPEVPGFLGWLARPAGDTSWPSIPRALGRGFVTVGSSPVLLLGTFVLLLVMWLGLVLVGLKGPAGQLVNLLALPPVSTYFDATNAVTIFGFGPTGIFASLGFIVVRSVVLAMIAGLVVHELLDEGGVADGLRRGLRAFPVVLAANMATFSLMILGSFVLPFLGPGLGFLGSILTLVAALFLFAFAPAAGSWETGRPFYEVIRRASRAALLPGSRHLLMCLFYIFLTLPILVALAPGGALRSVNPTLALWAYSLVTTFVHVSFLAAFSYRYLAVYDEIPEQPLKLRRR